MDRGLRFEEIESGFHFSTPQGKRSLEFLDLLRSEIPSGLTVLDVGCGKGIFLQQNPQRELAERSSAYWGVEPDTNIDLDPTVFSRAWRSNLEEADIPPGSVDVAFAAMVVEHVTDPLPFLRKVYDVLKPGGRFLATTISGWSILGLITRWTYLMGVQDQVLRLSVGEQMEGYHYPSVHKMTREGKLRAMAKTVGFSNARFAYTDNHNATTHYFPPSVRFVGYALDGVKKALRRPSILNNMFLILEK